MPETPCPAHATYTPGCTDCFAATYDQPIQLWLTDRSRYETGIGYCPRARYLEYHFGPSGYGIRPKSESIPLATGIYVHEGIAEVLTWCKTHGSVLPPPEVIREACAHAVETYRARVAAKGFLNLQAHDRAEIIAAEQAALIEGLVWTWCRITLPYLLERWTIIHVECEVTKILGCTCGLGDSPNAHLHSERGCGGIAWQTRTDFLTKDRQTFQVAYHELKTAGMISEDWETQWETKIQLEANCRATEEALELREPIHEVYIHGLIKGRREGAYNPETKKRDGEPYQQSVLCYGWRKPANPPLAPEDWQASYDYKDAQGKGHKLTRDYQRTPSWLFPVEAVDGAASPVEAWVRVIPPEKLSECLVLVGPFNRQPVVGDHFFAQALAEERRWQETIWGIYELMGEQGLSWASDEVQGLLDARVPCSWACRRFGRRHACAFELICLHREGWQDPLGTGFYKLRRPHHQPELEQAISRGLLPETDPDEEEEE